MTRVILCVAVCLALGGVSIATDSDLNADKIFATEYQMTLPNGMRVFLQAVPWAKQARIDVFYAGGASSDPDSLDGLAHLSEHLLTESSNNYPNGELVRLQTLYSTYRNTYTSRSAVSFLTRCLPAFIPSILELEVDRMSGVTIDSLSFARKKSVVLEEMAFRGRRSPESEFVQTLLQSSYPGHIYSRDIIGTSATVTSIGINDFVNFQTENIRPDRALLVVSGPIDITEMETLIRTKFAFGDQSEPIQPDIPENIPPQSGQFVFDAVGC